MLQNLKKKQEGFTIIEVMIVLVIAAVILLIVFLAVPALQRNSRNTQKKNVAADLLSAASEYSSNNNGAIPGNSTSSVPPGTTDADKILALVNTNSLVTTLTVRAQDGAASANSETVVIEKKAKCVQPTPTTATGITTGTGASNDRQIAIIYKIENSAGPTNACLESGL